MKTAFFGAAYYPEQYSDNGFTDAVKRDAKLMSDAGLRVARIGEFAWARMQPREDLLDFSWLDTAINILADEGIDTILCTPTAAPPKWLMDAHPDIYPINADGARRKYGARRHYCVNNPTYRIYTKQICTDLAMRYGKNKNVIGWQLDNELMAEGPKCCCHLCREKFDRFLERKYQFVDKLNERWGTSFWSQHYNSFSEIEIPLERQSPSAVTAYSEFLSDSYIEYAKLQADLIRRYSENQFITHNICSSGFLYGMDLYKFSEYMDIISVDNYPYSWDFETEYGYRDRFQYSPATAAFALSQIRGLKGAPFFVMEAQVGATSGPQRYIVEPGRVRAWSHQEAAHGASGIVFFRWKRARSGVEHNLDGILDADAMPHRRYNEISEISKKLINYIPLGRKKAPAAIIRDFKCDWSLDDGKYNPEFRYMRHIFKYFNALFNKKVMTDVISPNADFSDYRLIILPSQLVMDEKLSEALKQYTRAGGNVLITCLSALKDTDISTPETVLPYMLTDLLGLHIEEMFSLPPEKTVKILGKPYKANIRFDVVAMDTAAVIEAYGEQFFAGTPVFTVNKFGNGRAYYVGSIPDEGFAADIIDRVCGDCGIEPLIECDNSLIEVSETMDGSLYIINHGTEDAVDVPQLRRK